MEEELRDIDYVAWQLTGDWQGLNPVHLDTWVWCLHCDRCYQVKDSRFDGEYWRCSYLDCGGDLPLDSYHWLEFRSHYGMESVWPEVPLRGVVYDVYSDFVRGVR
jgi:hypothetical protein